MMTPRERAELIEEFRASARRRAWQEQRCPNALRLQGKVYEALKTVLDEQGRAQLDNLALYLGGRVNKGLELDPYMADECEETLRRVIAGLVK